jgi:hypothetical protein
MWTRKQNLFFVVLGVLIALAAFVINSGRAKEPARKPLQKRGNSSSLPNVVCHFANITVLDVSIKNEGAPEATVVVRVENNSEIGIVAIGMESTNGEESSGVTLRSSLEDDRQPIVVIKPHEVGTLEMALADVFPDAPLEIGFVNYADGTEKGNERSLKIFRELKTHEKNAKKKEPLQ